MPLTKCSVTQNLIEVLTHNLPFLKAYKNVLLVKCITFCVNIIFTLQKTIRFQRVGSDLVFCSRHLLLGHKNMDYQIVLSVEWAADNQTLRTTACVHLHYPLLRTRGLKHAVHVTINTLIMLESMVLATFYLLLWLIETVFFTCETLAHFSAKQWPY